MPKSEAAKLLSAGGAAAAIGGAYKFGEFLYKAKRLRDVGPSNAVYVRLIARVRADLDEVRRLLTVREVHDALEANPEKAKWVYGAMRDVRGALENITPHTERVGSDIEEGRRVGIRHRVFWLLSEKEKLENREKEVAIAHASLTEVIGYLTALEPEEPSGHDHRDHEKHGHREKYDHRGRHEHEHVDRRVDVDIDVRHEGPDRDVYYERDERGPRRVIEERETWVEHDHRAPRRVEEYHVEHEHHGPSHFEEHHVEREHRGPGRYDEREAWVDERGPRRYDEREVYVERGRDPRHESHYDERGLHVERDPRDPRHVEARYYERGPDRYEEKSYEERRYNEPLGRRPESFEDREPERDTWMRSQYRRGPPPAQYGSYGEYAEYGAPQPSGAANYRRKFQGDAGFGDEEVLNPQIVPPNREYEREVRWKM